MKDASHHLRHIQKKVIQSLRRESKQESPPQNSTQNGHPSPKAGAMGMQKFVSPVNQKSS